MLPVSPVLPVPLVLIVLPVPEVVVCLFSLAPLFWLLRVNDNNAMDETRQMPINKLFFFIVLFFKDYTFLFFSLFFFLKWEYFDSGMV